MSKRPLRESPNVRIKAKALRKVRQELGDNQRQFAERVGLSRSYINHIERMVRQTISPGAFKQICERAGVVDRSELIDADAS